MSDLFEQKNVKRAGDFHFERFLDHRLPTEDDFLLIFVTYFLSNCSLPKNLKFCEEKIGVVKQI